MLFFDFFSVTVIIDISIFFLLALEVKKKFNLIFLDITICMSVLIDEVTF